MAHSDTSPARRGLVRAAARARLAGTILTAAVLLVAPIVLWAQFGDGNVQHSIAVALVATLLCWCFIHRQELSDGGGAEAAPVAPGLAAAPAPAAGCQATRCRSARTTRPSRDVGCNAGERSSERLTRRRSRP